MGSKVRFSIYKYFGTEEIFNFMIRILAGKVLYILETVEFNWY